MVDHHVHFSVWARARTRVSLSDCHSMSSMLGTLRAALEARDSSKIKEPLVGKGLFVGQWPEEDVAKMGKAILDTTFPEDLPVIVILNDLHSNFCNTATLQLLGYPISHSGLFLEHEAFNLMVQLDTLDAHRMDSIIEEACIDAA